MHCMPPSVLVRDASEMDDDGSSASKLIELVRQYRALYDRKSTKYTDPGIRAAIWDEIGAKLKQSPEKCKDGWSKLRNCFTNAMKRRKRIKNGHATGAVLPPWKYEEQMSFLKPFIFDRPAVRAKRTNLTLQVNLPDDEMSRPGDETFRDDEYFGPDDEVSRPDSQNSQGDPIYFEETELKSRSVSPQSNSFSQSHRPPQNKLKLQDLYDLIKSSQEMGQSRQVTQVQDMDDTDLFFLSMSRAVKRLPKLDQTKIKLDLHKAVSEAEIRQLEKQP